VVGWLTNISDTLKALTIPVFDRISWKHWTSNYCQQREGKESTEACTVQAEIFSMILHSQENEIDMQ